MELIELKTPSGNTVFLKPYLTFGQKRELQKVWLKTMTVDPAKGEMKEFSPAIYYEAQDMALKMLIEKIVTPDGVEVTGPDPIYQFVQDMKDEDGQAVMDRINEISSLDASEDKKKAK